MKTKERKEKAQNLLINAALAAFYSIHDPLSSCYIEDETERTTLEKTMSDQLARVEKLFGYEPNSFGRS